MESAARDMRYDALQELAVQADLHHILLAHHQNDQAETVLLRLLRGAGPIGLAAMAPVMQRQGLSYVRPWLEVDRALILQQAELFASLTGWVPVSDPSNADDQYTRAALRERLAPELNERWPGWPGILAAPARQTVERRQTQQEMAY